MAAAVQPKSLSGYVRWLRHQYRQEPPIRLHLTAIGEGGTPKWSGDFLAWVNGGPGACGQDEDGYLKTPLRCAIYALHGRFEDAPRARMADYALALATTDAPWFVIAKRAGIEPDWARPIATLAAVRRIWDLYAPMAR